jgi:hypothetical protein
MKILLIGAVLCASSTLPASAADGYAGDKIVSVHSAACPPDRKGMRRPPPVTGGGRVMILNTGGGK